MLHEVMPGAGPGGRPWIELYNASEEPAVLDHARLATGAGHEWAFPAGVSEVPAGGFVLVRLELPPGTPSRVVEAVEGKLTLSAPAELAAPWRPNLGEAALYLAAPPGSGRCCLASYVAWGGEGSPPTRTPERLAIWAQPWYVALAENFGDYDLKTELPKGASIGRWPGSGYSSPATWALYDEDEVTPGRANAWPRPKLFSLQPGERIFGHRVELAWSGRSLDPPYEYEIADRRSHRTIATGIADHHRYISDASLPPGSYSFRVRRRNRKPVPRAGLTPLPPGDAGAWSAWHDFSRVERQPRSASVWSTASEASVAVTKTLPHMNELTQNKDSHLLCLEGCDGEHWNRPTVGDEESDHGIQYCVPASVAMMVSAYGGADAEKHLSQDRIAFELHKNDGDVDQQLGHSKPVNDYDPETGGRYSSILEWALGASVGQGSMDILFRQHLPPFPELKAWIDTDRPIMVRIRRHVAVIAGYDAQAPQQILVYDPMHHLDRWTGYLEFRTSADTAPEGVWVGPVSTDTAQCARVRVDEPSVSRDSDGDGIMDFDEIWRFQTKWRNIAPYPDARDTDHDGVPDLFDLRSYVLNAAGEYIGADPGMEPNLDGDSDRKETDPDNDGDGCTDGEEDCNRNGWFDVGESSCFNSGDCGTSYCACRHCHLPLALARPVSQAARRP